MEYAVPIIMGIGLASCAGLRAWLPLLMVSVLYHSGYAELNPMFAFLGRTDTLVLFLVASVVEVIGDKFAVVDHALDVAGIVLRPAAGAVLVSSVITSLDPLANVTLGLAVGGGAALTVNAGKALARTWVTAMVPAHGGFGNFFLSGIEDVAAAAGLGLVWTGPWLAALVALVLLLCSAKLVVMFIGQGGHLFCWLFGRARERDLKEASAQSVTNVESV